MVFTPGEYVIASLIVALILGAFDNFWALLYLVACVCGGLTGDEWMTATVASFVFGLMKVITRATT